MPSLRKVTALASFLLLILLLLIPATSSAGNLPRERNDEPQRREITKTISKGGHSGVNLHSYSFDEDCNLTIRFFVAQGTVGGPHVFSITNTTEGTVTSAYPLSPFPQTVVEHTIMGLTFTEATATISIGNSSLVIDVPEHCIEEPPVCDVDGFVISGAKYYDENGNGQRDPDEVGIPNWEIKFTYDPEPGIVFPSPTTTYTDQNGNYTIVLNTTGYGTLEEILGDYAGILEPTEPESGAYNDIKITCSGAIELDFGNTMVGCCPILGGYKFEDLDGDGVWDEEEEALSDWTIKLTASNGNSWTTQTDENGYYVFLIDNLSGWTSGLTTIREEFDPNEWTPTVPNQDGVYTLNVSSGTVQFNLDFGNHETQSDCEDILWDTSNGVLVSGGASQSPSDYYSDLANVIAALGYTVIESDAGVLHENLESYCSLIVVAGSSWNEQYTSAEVTAIETFVSNGGGLVVMSENPEHLGNPHINPVSLAFGVTVGTQEAASTANMFMIHQITDGVTELDFSKPGALAVSTPSVVVASDSMDIPVAAIANVGLGRVVVYADSTSWGNLFLTDGDNQQFASNVFDWVSP